MSSLLAGLLVPALAIAVNPVPIVAVVTLLAGDHGRRNAFTFLVAMVVVMVTIGALTIFVLGSESARSSATTAQAAAQTLFGVVFLTLFVAQWRARPRGADEKPGWMRLIDKAGLGAAVVLAFALTNYALLSAGAGEIRTSSLGASQQAAALAFFVIVALSTVAAPLALYLVRPMWAREQLGRLQGWLTRYDRVILMIVFGLMGALFTAQGVANLLH
jgi:Sap, sulfolipid-1-addressing protein